MKHGEVCPFNIDLQLGLRYGWPFSKELARQVALMVPVAIMKGVAEPRVGPNNVVATSGDIFNKSMLLSCDGGIDATLKVKTKLRISDE